MKKIRAYKKIKIEMSQKDFFELIIQKNYVDLGCEKEEQLDEMTFKVNYSSVMIDIDNIDGSRLNAVQDALEPWNHKVGSHSKMIKSITVRDISTERIIARLEFKI